MMDTQDISFAVAGQVLALQVPEGRPTTVTSVSVFHTHEGDNVPAESATTGSPLIESVDAIVDADSGKSQPNPRLLSLNDTSNVVIGRDYLVTGPNGVKEWIDVVEVDDGVSVTARMPLANDYVSGNAFEGTRVSIALDSTWVNDEHNLSGDTDPNPGYRVRWEYVVDGVSYVRYSYFDLVRAPASHDVRPIDIERMVPGFLNALPSFHREDQGRSLIGEAYSQVSIDFHEQGIADEQVRSTDIVNELVKRKAVVLWAEARVMTSGGSIEAVEVAQRAFDARWDALIRVPSQVRVPVATDGTGAARKVASEGLSVR